MPADAESRVDARRLTGDERTALRERAERARADAVGAAQRCVCLAAEVARLKSASDGRYAALSAARHELEETTSRFARLLKLLDTPPERAVTLLKEAVTEHVPLHSPEGRAIMEDVVRWGVRAFYEGVA
jgi:hypothetical protein